MLTASLSTGKTGALFRPDS